MAKGPRVNIYEAQQGAQASPGSPHVSPELTGAGVARAIGQFGSDIGQAGQEYLRQQEKEKLILERDAEDSAKAGAAVALSQMGSYLDSKEQGIKDEIGDDDPKNYAGRVAEETQKAGAGLLDKITHPKAKLYAETHLAALAEHRFKNAMTYERGARDEYGSTKIVNAAGIYAGEISRDPTMYPVISKAMNDMVDVMVSGPLREKHRDMVDKMLRISATVGHTARNPEEVYSATGTRMGVEPVVTPAQVAAEPKRVEASVQDADTKTLFTKGIIPQESGGKHFAASGGLLTSPKGAEGVSQVLPSTGRDPGYGVKPMQDKSRAEFERFGQDYLDAMVNHFKGDRIKGIAAYNAGPGAVEARVRDNPENWLADMPAETRTYVEMVTARMAHPKPEPVQVASAATGTLTDVGSGGSTPEAGTVVIPKPPDAGAPGVGTQTYPLRANDVADPAALAKGKSGIPYIDALTPTELVEARAHAHAAMQRDLAAGKAEIHRHDQDALAMAADGKTHPVQLTTRERVAKFGPVEGTRQAYEAAQVDVLASDIKSFSTMSMTEIDNVIKYRESDPNAEGSYGASEQRNALRLRARDEVRKQREADPAAYVAKTAPSVKAAHDAIFTSGLWLSQKPEDLPARNAAMADYMTKMQAEQERLGVKKTQLLPDSIESYIVRGAQLAGGSGDRMAAHITGLSQTFGKDWPKVYRQVVGGKNGENVPPSFIVIPGVAGAPGREEIARSDGMKLDELKKQVPSDVPKEITQNVQAQLAPFFQTMMPDAGNTHTANAIITVAEKLTYTRVIAGTDPDVAAKQVANILVGHLDIARDGSTRSYGVPKLENAAMVREGVKRATEGIGTWNLAPPDDLSDSRNAAERTSTFAGRVAANPVWVTNGDETGLLLYTTGENGEPRPARWNDGTQVFMDWQSLRGLAQMDRGNGPPTSAGGREQAERERAAQHARQREIDARAKGVY